MGRKFKMATSGPFGLDLSSMFTYSNAVRKVPGTIRLYIMTTIRLFIIIIIIGIFSLSFDLA